MVSGDDSFILVERLRISASMLRPEATVVGQNNSKVNFGILHEKEWGPQLPAHSRDTHDGFCRTIENFPFEILNTGH